MHARTAVGFCNCSTVTVTYSPFPGFFCGGFRACFVLFQRRVKKSVTALLPLLAQYNTLDFSRKYLKLTLAYLYRSCENR